MSCTSCSSLSTSSSFGGLSSRGKEYDAEDAVFLSTSGSFDFADVHDSVIKEGSDSLSKSKDSEELSASYGLLDGREERRKLYEAGCETKYCVSCSIFAPPTIAESLPTGVPGSVLNGGTSRNGSPILRSEEPFRVWDDEMQSDSDNDAEDEEASRRFRDTPQSFDSRASSSYHTHTLNYISTSNPIDPNIYSLFRKLVLRTLTGEELPRGLTSGKLAFDDATDRTTVAYKFRLADPYARGGYRFYALIALANSGNWGVFQAVAKVWERFQSMAEGLAERVDEHLAASQPAGHEKSDTSLGYLPVSSFLTGRDRPRTRGLTEMTGDEKIFAAIHLEFVSLLRELRETYA